MLDGQQATLARQLTDAVTAYEIALSQKPGDFQATNFLTLARSKVK